MSKFVREILAAVVMTAVVSAGAFAQGRGQDKQRPKKEPVKVIDGKGRGSKPPPREQPKPPKENRGKKRP